MLDLYWDSFALRIDAVPSSARGLEFRTGGWELDSRSMCRIPGVQGLG